MTTVSAAGGRRERRLSSAALIAARTVVRAGPALILLLLVITMFVLTPAFLTVGNLGNVGTQASVVAILGIGQFFAILTRGIDLSVGSVVSLATVVGALVFARTGSGVAAVAGMLGVGLLVGVVNGLVLVKWHIPHPFIVTLGMLNIASGVALLLSGGSAILGVPPAVSALGSAYLGPLPVAVLFTAGLALLAYGFTNYVKGGRWLYAVGGNPEGARRAGIPVGAVLVLAYALAGGFAACAALLVAGRTGTGYPTAGLGLELDAIAAVIIGGTSFFGGRGTIGGVLIGALSLAVIRNGLNLLNVDSFWQQVAIGVVVIAAVGFDVVRARLERRLASAGLGTESPARSRGGRGSERDGEDGSRGAGTGSTAGREVGGTSTTDVADHREGGTTSASEPGDAALGSGRPR